MSDHKMQWIPVMDGDGRMPLPDPYQEDAE